MGSQSNSDAAPATVDELKTIQDVTRQAGKNLCGELDEENKLARCILSRDIKCAITARRVKSNMNSMNLDKLWR